MNMTTIIKRKPGRPKIENKREIVGTALEPDLIDWIEKECEVLGFTRSYFIRNLLLKERELKGS
jgi:hypothetical protein